MSALWNRIYRERCSPPAHWAASSVRQRGCGAGLRPRCSIHIDPNCTTCAPRTEMARETRTTSIDLNQPVRSKACYYAHLVWGAGTVRRKSREDVN